MKTTSEIVKVLERVLENFNMADIKYNDGAFVSSLQHRNDARRMLENLYKEISQEEVKTLMSTHDNDYHDGIRGGPVV